MNIPRIKKTDTVVCSAITSIYPLGITLGTICLVAACVFSATPSQAQPSSAVTAVYGRGVHAYFSGNSAVAEQRFTEVIQAGSTDPRPYYFRAMVRLNQGRQYEAENDMRVGAAYEARNPGVHGTIGRSLQRVQGPGRRTLEKFRREARLNRVQRGRQQTRQRYEQLDQRAPAVLRRPAALPLSQPVQPPQMTMPGSGTIAAPAGSATKTPPAQQPAQTDALATPPAQVPPVQAQPLPATTGMEADEDDLFGTPAPVTPADDDPFGAAAPTQAPTPAPTEADPFGDLPAPAAEEADPFGESTPAPAAEESDPFGESASSEEPTESEMTDDDPFGASEPTDDEAPAEADDSDPFGDASGSDEMESEESDDPFGESTESTDDEGDPFGESSDSTDQAPADDEDPFGESMDGDSESSDGDSTPEDDEPDPDSDDPFGEFGATPGQPMNQAFPESSLTDASSPQATAPTGQFFFALGQWLGSRGNSAASTTPQFDTVTQADFELGPTELSAAPTDIEATSAEADPFAVPEADESPANELDAEDPFDF